jgi:L-alanine-DL-glutamate epimerase-like enolase superfamily enzyme
MKITSAETIVVRIPYSAGDTTQTQAWGGKEWLTADALLVKVETDEGITGWGEAFGYNIIPATRVVLDEIVAPMCIGADALDINALMRDLQQKLHIFGRGGPIIYALSGLDIALWDIAGKVAGQPLNRLLGGKPCAQLPAYASLIRYSEPGMVAKHVKRACDSGFRHIKLHEITVEAVAAARDAAGPDVAIMLDVNCPWSVAETLEISKLLRPLNLAWLEEPVWPPEDHESLSTVRAQCGIPIAAGENAATLQQYRQMLDAGAVDILQPSPAKMGGVSVLQNVFELANEYGTKVVPHSFYEGPGLLASMHVSAAMSSDPLVEWRFFDLEARLYGEEIVPRNGQIALPDGPGLGRDPDPDVLDRYRAP